MIYVALASRKYGEGRVIIHTDRIGGVRTGHGENPKNFWRRMLEWASSKKSEETIKVGLVINSNVNSVNSIYSLNPIYVDRISKNPRRG